MIEYTIFNKIKVTLKNENITYISLYIPNNISTISWLLSQQEIYGTKASYLL